MRMIILGTLLAALIPGAWAADDKQQSREHYLAGVVQYDQGHIDKARGEWERALKLDPSNVDAKTGLERLKNPDHSADQKKAESQKADAAGLYAGYRGVSLSLPGHQLAFLKKGDYIDVMVTFDAKMTDRKEKVTATILQNVRIVDVLKPAKTEEHGTIQILLNPNEAQYAALSDAQGDLHVALRAPGDTEMHPMEMASFRKLFR